MIAFGFWPGDEEVAQPAYYSYTSPEPHDLREQPLKPTAARWVERGAGSLALLPYETVRTADDPREVLLCFLEGAYQAGARTAGWTHCR